MIALVMYAAFSLAVAVLVVWFVSRHNAKKRQAAHDAEIKAASEEAAKRGPFVPGVAPAVHTRRYAGSTYSRRDPQPAPTVVYRDSGMDPLMAGAIGYMIGSSVSHYEHTASECRAPDFEAAGGSMGGGGASSSWDDSSSSSSDSGSSYDSGSSDSGSSSSSD